MTFESVERGTSAAGRSASQLLSELWDEHVGNEFVAKDTAATLDTMVFDAYVNHVPVLTGGVGRKELYDFYSKHFIPKMPADTEFLPISRTIGPDRLVDEMIVRFTHTIEMDWMLPGIPPTGKRVECATVAIVTFRDGKLAHEHIYWDQASVLVQLGLMDASTLPVAGRETARKLADPSLPSNELIKRRRVPPIPVSTRIPSATARADVIPSHAFSNASLLAPPATEGPNGGYLAKVLWEASVDRIELDDLAPRVVAVQFISPPVFEPLRIDVDVLRRSRHSCFVSVTADQAGELRLVAQLLFGRSEPGPYHRPDEMPAVPAPELCPEVNFPASLWPHFSQHCEYRLAHGPAVFSAATHAEVACWIRLRDIALDAAGMLFLFDSMFPPFFLAAISPHRTVTTHLHVEYADSFVEEPSGVWVLLSLRVRDWGGGWCIEDADAWAAGGRLLAVARQLRRVFA